MHTILNKSHLKQRTSKMVSTSDKAKQKSLKELNDFESDFDDSEDEVNPILKTTKEKRLVDDNSDVSDSDEEDEEDDIDEENEGNDVDEENKDDVAANESQIDDDEDNEDEDQLPVHPSKKLLKFTPEELQKQQKRIKRTGVCYLSKIPPYMRPSKLRSIMSRFGKVDRLFLKPEDTLTHQKRVKYGGNKKRMYTEGWVEFVNKKDAKLAVLTLNANTLGGKKNSYYYDDVINIKYLSGFKWLDLTQQIAKETEIRQAKLTLELSQQQKLNKDFINNVEKSKTIKKIEKKRKEKNSDSIENDKVRRQFKQRKITSTRADAKDELKEKSKPNEKLNNVLSKVF